MTKRTDRMSLKHRSYKALTPRENKIWLLIEKGGCQLPSCAKVGNIEEFARHHWDFEGKKEDPYLFPNKIHLLCIPCHDLVHRIASMSIFYLDLVGMTDMGKIVCQVKQILNANEKDIRFVLLKEFKPAGIIKEDKGKCKLIRTEKRRIRNIKKYIRTRNLEQQKSELGNLSYNPG